MWCKTCQYPLKQLSEPRCPECGLAFDPNDPETFDHKPERGPRASRILTLFAWVYVASFLVVITTDRSGWPNGVLQGLLAFVSYCWVAMFITMLIVWVPLVPYIVWARRRRLRSDRNNS